MLGFRAFALDAVRQQTKKKTTSAAGAWRAETHLFFFLNDVSQGEVQYFRFGYGGNGNNDMGADPPPSVLGPHIGMKTDSETFDMDRPTYEDEKASAGWYGAYDPKADIKPFT